MTKKKFAVAFGLFSCILGGLFHELLILKGESLILLVAPEQQRMRATERLVARQSVDSLPGLRRALQDSDSEIQEAACHGLMELGHEHPEALILLFSHGPLERDPLDGRLRFPFFTRNAIARHPEESQGSLLKSLEILNDRDRRLAVLKVLQWTGEGPEEALSFVKTILEALKANDPESYDPCFALLSQAPLRRALALHKSKFTASSFVDAMIRVLSGVVLKDDLSLLIEKLESSKLSEALVAARILTEAKAPKSVLPFLLRSFRGYCDTPGSQDIVEARRTDLRLCRFLDLLGSMRAAAEDGIPDLLRLLETSSDDQTVAGKAAQTLTLIDTRGRALSPLKNKLLQRPINPFVFDAIEAYGERGRAVFPTLIEIYRDSGSRQDKHRIVQVLSRAPVLESVPFLSRLLEHGNRYERGLAKEALGHLKALKTGPKQRD
ncbi:MAG: hypothetical protein P1V97_20320 [Planctomycetota bacterium]|nr:hypothetical protein [Planctomycetota bacterium]